MANSIRNKEVIVLQKEQEKAKRNYCEEEIPRNSGLWLKANKIVCGEINYINKQNISLVPSGERVIKSKAIHLK